MLERKLLEMESRKAQLNIKIEINGRIENDEFIPKSKIGDWQSVFRNEKYDLKFNGVDYTTMYDVDINKEINISSTKSITAVCNLLACGPGPDYDEEGNERFAESDDEEMQDSEEDVEENQA
uniref:Uncharacterized protein n=1 Tax=Acrobeloides nanus TaxID=290746 RepID=A0A914C375_9BILA